jgi:hypothetical protein
VAVAADKRKQKAKGKSRATKKTQAAAKDPGPPYRAVWHSSADAERDASWPPDEKVPMLHAVEKLEAAGPRLGSPHSSAVQGERGRGLRELRRRAGRSPWRPIYRRASPSTFVIRAVAPEAQIDSRGFDTAVRRAVERFGRLELDSGPIWSCR